MVEITVILSGRTSCFHCVSHLSAIVTDISKDTQNKPFKVHYPFRTNAKFISDISTSLYGNMQNNCCIGVVRLYSNKNFESFVKLFHEKFDDHKKYQYCSYNCSTAVNFTLDYFFPEDNAINCFLSAYQLCCGLLTCGGLGLRCFPMLPCIDSPIDVFDKAQTLTCSYGKLPKDFKQDDAAIIQITEQKGEKQNGEKKESKDSSHNTTSRSDEGHDIVENLYVKYNLV